MTGVHVHENDFPSLTALACLLAAASAGAQPRSRDAFPFERVALTDLYENHSGFSAEARGSITHMVGAGVCVLDYDMDGTWDLFFPDRRLETLPASGNRLLRGLAAPGRGYEDATEAARLPVDGWSVGCAVADIDNDGDPDLFVTRIGANRLFRNEGDGTFREDPLFAEASAFSTSATFADLDLDGLVDLYVCNYIDLSRVDLEARCPYYGIDVFCGPNGLPGAPDVLYRNRAGGTFEDVTEPAGVLSAETRGFSVLALNLDDDRLPELHVANDAGVDLLFRNLGGFAFEDISLLSGAGYSASGLEQSGMGSTAGDFDDDGDTDLYVTNFQRDYNTLYRNDGGLTFTDTTHRAGLSLPTLPYLAWGANFLDVGNDGQLDLFVANGHIYPELEDHPEIGEPYRQSAQLFLAREGGYTEAQLADDVPRRLGRGTALVDIDENGTEDVIVNNLGEAPDLYLGRAGDAAWIRLKLVGTSSNRDGLNAVARARLGEGGTVLRRELRPSDGFLGSGAPLIHIGLGAAERLPEVAIEWPNGGRDRCTDVTTRAAYLVKEGVGCFEIALPASISRSR